MNLKKVIRGLVLAVMASALVYAVLIFVSDGPAVMAALSGFRFSVLAAMLALSIGCYLLRGLRWGRLMGVVGFPVSVRDAVYLHMAGQTMSVSPGRVGEVLKPWLAREIAEMPMSRGIALVFAERVADLIAVCILALGGITALGGGVWTLLGALVVILSGAAVASSGWFHRLALGVVAKQSWAQSHHASASSISETIRVALGWRTLWWSVVASVVAWGLEGIGFFLCIKELGFAGFDVWTAVSVYAVSTIIGAFTFLPGGIGVTEASMAGILVRSGMAASAASAATLVVRVVTLWWAVVLGWAVIATRPALFRRLMRGVEVESDDGSAAQ